LVQKFSRIKEYKALAFPDLLYGSEISTLASIERKFIRRTAGCARFDHKGNAEIVEHLKLEPVHKKLRIYKSNWL